ncbi:MAG: GntR family transcriptional regulator [Pigmentiphaga sp.]|nr:GntR family transcriptional regulator [Pigmentiphaga sp.]
MLNKHLPLWYQVSQGLRAEILDSGHDAPYRLPTEVELAKAYDVSLVTLRQALQVLEAEGLITRKRRLGTFANPTKKQERPLKLVGLAEAVMVQHTTDESVTLGHELIPVPVTLAKYFPVPKVYEIRRLRIDDGIPVAYAVNYLLPEYGKQLPLSKMRGSVTRLLKEELGVKIRRFQNTVEAALPQPDVARELQIDVMTPILLINGVTTDHQDRVVDVLRLHYRSDRFRFSLDIDIPA